MFSFRTIWLVPVALCLTAVNANAACDEFVGNILSTKLRPVVEGLDCSVLKQAGLDKKGHKLNTVCYETSGPTSRVRLDTSLNCHSSDESVVAKALGASNTPSVSENVSVEAEVRGPDCGINSIHIQPSGELGKALASMFDADGEARKSLQQGLNQICTR